MYSGWFLCSLLFSSGALLSHASPLDISVTSGNGTITSPGRKGFFPYDVPNTDTRLEIKPGDQVGNPRDLQLFLQDVSTLVNEKVLKYGGDTQIARTREDPYTVKTGGEFEFRAGSASGHVSTMTWGRIQDLVTGLYQYLGRQSYNRLVEDVDIYRKESGQIVGRGWVRETEVVDNYGTSDLAGSETS